MKVSTFFFLGALMAGAATLPVSAAPVGAFADGPAFAAPGTTVTFQVDEKTQVPGRVLKSGSYSIVVVDHLSDRMILKITGANSKEQTLFLAVPSNGRIPKQVSAGPIVVKLGAKSPALRGFAFPNGAVAEFVYPKAEAVTLAKNNNTSVPAIDPASEGRPKASSLSGDDLQMVTLWMLTPSLVGSGDPGISAQRLQVAEASAPPPPASPAALPVASAPARQPAPPRQPVPVSAKPAPAEPAQVAEAVPVVPKPRKVAHPIAQLPHTASSEPLWLLTGLISLFAAMLLTMRRWTIDAR